MFRGAIILNALLKQIAKDIWHGIMIFVSTEYWFQILNQHQKITVTTN